MGPTGVVAEQVRVREVDNDDIHTYVPEETVDSALTAFLRKAAAQTSALIGANGERLRLPKAIHDVQLRAYPLTR